MNIRKVIREIINEVMLKEYDSDEVDYYNDDESEQYYTPTISDDIKEWSNEYEGRNVVWYGDPEQMIAIHKSQVEGMWGNIYEPQKMDYIVKLITDYPEKVEIECSYGHGNIINIIDIVEEQQAMAEGRFETDYDGKDSPSTTGNEELDRYVGEEDYIEDEFYHAVSSEVEQFMKSYKLSILSGKENKNSLTEKFKVFETDPEDGEDYKDEGDYDAFNEFIRLETELDKAQEDKDGDFNKFSVQLRDGHHRVMGAIKSGEEYICLNLVKEDIIKFKGHYQKV